MLNHENHENAWAKYYNLCKLGGSKSFTGLLDEVGLENPFTNGALERIMPKVCEILSVLEKDTVK